MEFVFFFMFSKHITLENTKSSRSKFIRFFFFETSRLHFTWDQRRKYKMLVLYVTSISFLGLKSKRGLGENEEKLTLFFGSQFSLYGW